jgi:hypothetical protein
MDRSTLVSVPQRNEGLWIGLLVLVGGSPIPGAVALGTADLAGVLIGVGALVLAVGVLVASLLVLRTASEAWRQEYAEGRSET